jgi:hypothetical protein
MDEGGATPLPDCILSEAAGSLPPPEVMRDPVRSAQG